jgi:Flp pilus assembly protein TadD
MFMKRTLFVLSITAALIVAVEPSRTVHGILLSTQELAIMNALAISNAVPPEGSRGSEVQGNGFVRALKAPFKAIGRLFGGGKKDKNRVERISAKDMKQFGSVSAPQVNTTGLAVTNPVTTPADNPSEVSPLVPTTAEQSLESVLEIAAAPHLEKGRALLDEHDLNGAIAELSVAVSLNPKSGEANSLLGVAYWRKGLRDRAQTSFEAAIETDKPDPQYLNNLGYLLYEIGEYEKATKYLKRAAKLAPEDPRIMNNLGLAQSERGHYDDAFKSFARALGEVKGHINVAQRLERHGQSKKAIKHLEKALALKPNSPEVLARLADLYDGQNKPGKAQIARAALVTLRMTADAAAK